LDLKATVDPDVLQRYRDAQQQSLQLLAKKLNQQVEKIKQEDQSQLAIMPADPSFDLDLSISKIDKRMRQLERNKSQGSVEKGREGSQLSNYQRSQVSISQQSIENTHIEVKQAPNEVERATNNQKLKLSRSSFRPYNPEQQQNQERGSIDHNLRQEQLSQQQLSRNSSNPDNI
jgi:hypothetical protein